MDRTETTALLHRARNGSPEALEDLYDRLTPRLLGLIRLRMGPGLRAHLESRDILQAALLKSFRHIEDLEKSDAASLMAWLARIAENEIRDQADYQSRQRRDAAREVPMDDALPGLAARMRSVLSGAILTEEMQRLERALESLDASQREVILLRKYEELSFREIGERLSRSEDAARMTFAWAYRDFSLPACVFTRVGATCVNGG